MRLLVLQGIDPETGNHITVMALVPDDAPEVDTLLQHMRAEGLSDSAGKDEGQRWPFNIFKRKPGSGPQQV